VAIPASVVERDVLAARVADYAPRLLDELTAAGEVVWVGAGPLGPDDGKIMVFLRDRAPLLRPLAGSSASPPASAEHERLRQILDRRGACFFRELSGAATPLKGPLGPSDKASLDALWDLVWAGEVTNDSFAPVRALAGASGRSRRGSHRRVGRPHMGSLSVLGPPRAQGRWSLVEADLPTAGVSPTQRAHALASVLLDRHGVLMREAVRGEGHPGGFAAVYSVLRAMEDAGRVRRGYFVAGLGGAQFALAGAVDRLRSTRSGSDGEILILAATDPANPFGVSLPWPREGLRRVAGAYVVFVDGLASLYVERAAKGLVALRDLDGFPQAIDAATHDRVMASEGRVAVLLRPTRIYLNP